MILRLSLGDEPRTSEADSYQRRHATDRKFNGLPFLLIINVFSTRCLCEVTAVYARSSIAAELSAENGHGNVVITRRLETVPGVASSGRKDAHSLPTSGKPR